MPEHLLPGSVLIAGALLLPLLPGRLRPVALLLLPLLSFAQTWSLPDGARMDLEFLGYALVPLRADPLARLFGVVFHIAAGLSVLYALHVKNVVEHMAALLYAGSAIAAVYAGDLLTLFLFWEGTAIASVVLIWSRRTERARRAGSRYLLVQVTSGVLLLAGAVLHYADTGSLAFGRLDLASPGGTLMFLAFGIKAAFPLLHGWLKDAYPEATITGTVFLSAFTTKLAIYALARGFPGSEALIAIGAVMTVFPVFYGVIENDLRRVLAYSLNSQLGFMVTGIGIGTEQALNGVAAHAFAHIIYKGLLFMAMGAVLLRTGTVRGSELGGLYRSMPWTTAFCLVGAASIAGFPLLSGFVTKSFVLDEVAGGQHTAVFLALLFTSACVMPYVALRVPFFAFFWRDTGRRVREAPLHMLLAMGLSAALCIGIGVYPQALFALLPFPVTLEPYTATHVVAQGQLLLFSGLAFGLLLRAGRYPLPTPSRNLDVDWLYRDLLPKWIGRAFVLGLIVRSALAARLRVRASRLAAAILWAHGPKGWLGEPWPTGTAALWAALLLGVYLVLFYV